MVRPLILLIVLKLDNVALAVNDSGESVVADETIWCVCVINDSESRNYIMCVNRC